MCLINWISEMNGNIITLFSGILSFFGAGLGAFAAYGVMSRQRKLEKKDDKEYKTLQTIKTFKKLQTLNGYINKFVTSFDEEFNKPYSEEMGFKLKSSEPTILWLSNSVDIINDELLSKEYMVAYIKFNHLVNHTYNEFRVFNDLPEEQKSKNLTGFVEVVKKLKENLVSFEAYTEEQLKKLEMKGTP